jgi:hypothetical protein
VFALDIGGLSQPVQTDASTWALFKLVEKDVRPLEDIPFDAAKNAFYNKWLQDLKNVEGALDIIGFSDEILPKEPAVASAQ